MSILRSWQEMDLTAEARAGRLAPAFEVDETVQIVTELLDIGRCPILTGESGIGKTAVVHEIVRRVRSGAGPRRLAGRRIVQISLQRRIAGLEQRHEIHGELHKLSEALLKMRRPPALFIRDIALAYQFDLEDRLAALATLTDAPIIGEGPDGLVSALLEHDPVLEQQFAPVRLDEPNLEQAGRILAAWTDERRRGRGVRFSTDAIDEALTLTHRFQSRSRLPHKAIELLSQSEAEIGQRGTVSGEQVIDRFCAVHRVPRVLVDPKLPLELDRVRRRFERNVFGQAEAVSSVVDMIGVLKAGLSDIRRPLATMLLVGPTGVGKTFIAQLVAETLFGCKDRLVRINLADYPSEGGAASLFGDSDDHRPSGQRGVLTSRLAGHPFAVLLLDEFEKAHGSVHDRFLQLIDEGTFINGAGDAIPCRSLIIIATSNAGYEHGLSPRFGFPGQPADVVSAGPSREFDKRFRFELLNRFDRVVHFAPLSADDVRNVALAQLRQLPERIGLRQRQLRIQVERRVLDWIVDRGFDPDRGARNIRRMIEQHVTVALARALAQASVSAGSTLRLVLRANSVDCRVVTPAAGAVRSDRRAEQRRRHKKPVVANSSRPLRSHWATSK